MLLYSTKQSALEMAFWPTLDPSMLVERFPPKLLFCVMMATGFCKKGGEQNKTSQKKRHFALGSSWEVLSNRTAYLRVPFLGFVY